jgi:hypothetical protein
MTTVRNWVWHQNIRALVDVLTRLSRYELSESEWEAIRLGVEQSDSDATPPRWYKFELRGKHNLQLNIGHDKGTDVVQVRLELPDSIALKAEVALDLMNQFILTRRGGFPWGSTAP